MADVVREILATYRRVAMVGASPKEGRPSLGVAGYLVRAGFDLIPVNPRAERILDIECAPDLAAAAARGPLEIVNIFRRPEDVPPIVDEAIALGAKAIWMQLGIASPEAAERARRAGLAVVEDHCIAVEHNRIFGE